MTVVYASDRRMYQFLPTAIGSLLTHNPDAFVYIVAEDSQINCIKRTDNIKIININDYPEFINRKHYNCTQYWGFFTNVKCFLTKLITEDKILYLDVDTIVMDNLNELWDTDINDYAFAGWREKPEAVKHAQIKMNKSQYVNAGVLLMNLKLIKDNKFDDKMVKYLNNNNLKYPDQDALNIICDGYIKYFGAEYNFGPIVSDQEKAQVQKIKIYHMTRIKLWSYPNYMPGLWPSYYKNVLYK